jgi:hypothetical protein
MRHTVAATVAAGIATAWLAGCSTLTNTTGPNSGPTTADAALVGTGLQTTVESSIASFLGGVAPPTQSFSRSGARGTLPYLRLAHVPVALVHGSWLGARNMRSGPGHTVVTPRDGVPSCVTVVPATPSDQDSDGIPDTVTMTAGQGCTFTNDTLTLSVSGSMSYGDPTPATPDADYMATVNNLTIGFSNASDTATVALNGAATVTETSGSLSQSNQLTVTIMSTGTDTVNTSFAQNWMATFAFSGSPLMANQGLPAGSVSFTGTTNYTGNGKSFALAISTPTALTFDPTCTTASQVTAGTLQATFSGTNGTAYVSLTWSGCQDPAIYFATPG